MVGVCARRHGSAFILEADKCRILYACREQAMFFLFVVGLVGIYFYLCAVNG